MSENKEINHPKEIEDSILVIKNYLDSLGAYSERKIRLDVHRKIFVCVCTECGGDMPCYCGKY